MAEYEISYLVDPRLKDEERTGVDRSVDDAITTQGGTISWNSESTRRRLAFPLKGQRITFLRTVQADIKEELLATLRTEIARQAGVMRCSILRTAKRTEVPAATLAEIKPVEKPTAAVPAKPISEEELEAKIAKALQEEVK